MLPLSFINMAFTTEINPVFQLAADCITFSNRNVFLTGKAGTGKTTFLKYIRENCAKQMVVMAPTGVAAINAGGTTIHSFFQLPFTPYIPESAGGFFAQNVSSAATDKHHLLGRLKYSRDKIDVLQKLELLIIDEISMVRCDVLDAIDIILRSFRYRHQEAFGGVQVLLIGDMYQLPPVTVQDEWQILSSFYESPYFFDSRVMQQQKPVYIELEKIYRQTDNSFIQLLNKIRHGEMDMDAGEMLLSRYDPSFKAQSGDGYITLTTHNYLADKINNEELQRLEGKLYTFNARIEKEFSEKSYPAEELLQLKVGAQVMFLKNDMEKVRRYYNGKTGIVEKIDQDKIFVKCGNEKTIELARFKWENIRYTLNKQTQRVEEDIIGSFEQFPLQLAWAVTIHKSQGLTFEKVVIDAGAAFAPGQVYVALSRCTSLRGIVLHSPVTQAALRTDMRINRFAETKSGAGKISADLNDGKHAYQQQVLKEIFDISHASRLTTELNGQTREVASSFNDGAPVWVNELEEKITKLQQVAARFQKQVQQLSDDIILPEDNTALQERVKAAAKFFSAALQQLLQFIIKSPAVTDSRQHALAYAELLKKIHLSMHYQLHLIKSCLQGFSIILYSQFKKDYAAAQLNINAYSKGVAYTYSSSPHPDLLKQLRSKRDAICDRNDLPIYIVAGTTTLEEMARYLPQTKEELMRISGFGNAKVEKYGDDFLPLIQEYCNLHALTSLIHEKSPKREKKEPDEKKEKTDTKKLSYDLYKSDKTIAEIATERNLAVSTIEGHLSHYIQTGEIKLEELVSDDKKQKVINLLQQNKDTPFGEIKTTLGDAVSYGEIRMIATWLGAQKKEGEDMG